MHPTTVLPTGYIHYGNFQPSSYRKVMPILFMVGSLMGIGLYFLVIALIPLVRPGFIPIKNASFKLTTFAILLSAGLIVILLHESLHAISLYLVGHIRPKIVFKLSLRVLAAYVESPGWFLPRNIYILVALAPVSILTITGLGLIFILPQSLLSLVAVCVAGNLAGSLGDLAVAGFLFLLPASTLATTQGDIYVPEGELTNHNQWKKGLRLWIEQILKNMTS